MFHSRFSRLILSIFVLSSLLWIGFSIARLVVGYDAFIAGTVTLKPKLSQPVLLQTIWMYTNLGMWTTVTYFIAAVMGLILIPLNRMWLKSYGWFMMSAILFVILIPVQVFLIDADLHLWSFFDYRTGMALAQPAEIIAVFSQRFSNQAIGITTTMAILAGITIVLFTTMRPLHHSSKTHES